MKDEILKLSEEELLKKLETREIKPRDLDETFGIKRAAELRRKFLEQQTNTKLDNIGNFLIDPENCKRNIELMMGATQVPLGYAGPVPVNGEYAKGNFFIPLATTEGALVASVNRGCSIIRRCKGANVYVHRYGQTRSILFNTKTIMTTKKFVEWVKNNDEKLKEIAEKDSRFLELKKIEVTVAGNNVWLRLDADTKDAMGMNMITFAAENIGNYIEKNFEGIEFISASGNLCIDKKPSAMNLVKGRGKTVLAEVIVPNKLIKEYLKTTAQKVLDLNYRKNILGSMIAGSFGFNSHFANIIAALYLATGQDIGHVVEGSQGYTVMDLINDDLYISVTLPSIQVGTVGGGTNIETQKECLKLLGVNGGSQKPGENAMKLAEVTGVAVLAGELSLIGALTAKHLGKAHKELNR